MGLGEDRASRRVELSGVSRYKLTQSGGWGRKTLVTRFSSTTALIAMLVALLAACATSHVMLGKARPQISPDQVQIYDRPPPGPYQEIARLDTSSQGSFSFTAQGKTDAVIKRLKEEAAKLGANGVLLEGIGDQASGSIGTGAGGGGYSGGGGIGINAGLSRKIGGGLAIYVGQ
jgi:hypothetical protein